MYWIHYMVFSNTFAISVTYLQQNEIDCFKLIKSVFIPKLNTGFFGSFGFTKYDKKFVYYNNTSWQTIITKQYWVINLKRR